MYKKNFSKEDAKNYFKEIEQSIREINNLKEAIKNLKTTLRKKKITEVYHG